MGARTPCVHGASFNRCKPAPSTTLKMMLTLPASDYSAAIISISTKAPLGRSFTANAERAGNGCSKNSA